MVRKQSHVHLLIREGIYSEAQQEYYTRISSKKSKQPHLFALADVAFRDMFDSKKSQVSTDHPRTIFALTSTGVRHFRREWCWEDRGREALRAATHPRQ
jgi:hypothetical protein